LLQDTTDIHLNLWSPHLYTLLLMMEASWMLALIATLIMPDEAQPDQRRKRTSAAAVGQSI
jgi:hypothetical protein